MDAGQMRMRKLAQDLPWVQWPLVANAPMGGVATSRLAIAVSESGGLGQVGFTGDVSRTQSELEKVKQGLQSGIMGGGLPIGVGIICLDNEVAPWLPVFQEYKPATTWLSFGSAEQFSSWAQGIRNASPQTKIWIQIGDVSSALDAAKACHPDALVLQGSDAGGHGHAHSASLMTLIPEVVDGLYDAGIGNVPVIAAGGIMEGRGAAAAMVLGASGVVLGTRYLGAQEAVIDEDVRERLFSIVDGGAATVRSRVFDDIWGRHAWHERYNGRCVKGAIYSNSESGMSIEDIRREIYRESRGLNDEKASIEDYTTIWAGTGVGMLKGLESASDITTRIRDETRKVLQAKVENVYDGDRSS